MSKAAIQADSKSEKTEIEIDAELQNTETEKERIKAYKTPFEIHADFVREIVGLVGGYSSDLKYQFVHKPSALYEQLSKIIESQTIISLAMYAPMTDGNGQVKALSLDANGDKITAADFERMEREAWDSAATMHRAQNRVLTLAVLACNRRMRDFAARHKKTTADMYAEVNARFVRLHYDSTEYGEFEQAQKDRIALYMSSNPDSWWSQD